MDSQFLNMFHDDQFDGNYTKYENSGTTDLWSTENDTMSIQLSETLHGILPIAATDINVYKCGYKNGNDDANIAENLNNALLSTVNNNFTLDMDENNKVSKIGNYLNNNRTNYEIDKKALDYDSDNDDDDPNGLLQRKSGILNDNDDICSTSSFRSRTDSSSIGDYESHTSDYDDDDDDNFMDNDVENLLTADNFLLEPKQRTYSTNTLGSDVDCLEIDTNNFDLADFITKDDNLLQVSTHDQTTNKNHNANENSQPKQEEQNDKVELVQQHKQQPQHQNKGKIEEKNEEKTKITRKSTDDDGDSDSDIIVDVETLEFDSEASSNAIEKWKTSIPPVEDDVLQYKDNVKADPSWNPTSKNKTKNTSIKVKEKTRNGAISTKRQCNYLNNKVVTTTKDNNKKVAATKQLPSTICKAALGKNKNTTNSKLIYGGKSLALIKQQLIKSGDAYIYSTPSSAEKNKINAKLQIPHASSSNKTVKRKLNLEEYKQRKLCETTKTTKSQILLPNQQQQQQIIPKKNKTSEEVTAVIKTLKEQQQQQQQQCPNPKTEQKELNTVATDPLIAAKNKVLRMQALKRAQQLKILDSRISAKVPRVTKLLPLKDIIKDSYCASANSNDSNDNNIYYQRTGNSDLEEVVVLSAGCNTIISIPPLAATTLAGTLLNLNSHNNSSRSLLKPLTKITHNSLISSIQHVMVQKKGLSVTGDAKLLAPSSTIGENKIIMHLPKDRHLRHRYLKQNMSVQTEYVAEFPPLVLWPTTKTTHTMSNSTTPTETTTTRIHKRHKISKHRKSVSDKNNYHGNFSNEQNFKHMEQNNANMLFPQNDNEAQQQNSDYYASSRSSRRHRSSVSSSSFSDSEHSTRYRRQRCMKNQRDRSSSSSSSLSSTSSSSSSCSSSSSKSMASRSHSRSRSPSTNKRKKNNNTNYVNRNVKQPAVEERRIVYVGRIEDETNKEMLRRKFLKYGTIKQITIHYKQTGMKFGFITYARSEDAFNVIDNGHKDPQINAYDLSFGGRRAFCRSSYADLDNAGINTYESYVFPQAIVPSTVRAGEDSFEELLKKVKADMSTTKKSTSSTTITDSIAGNVKRDHI